MEEREQFTFYASFAKAIRRIKKAADRAAAYDAIVNYALYEIEPDMEKLPDSAASLFEVIKPFLDTSRRKAENGKKGGKAKADEKQEQAEIKPEANVKQTSSKPEANEKQEQTESKNKDKNKNKNKNKCLITPISSSFAPPTLDEVKAYIAEKGLGVDAEFFWSYYNTSNWTKKNGDPVLNWKQTLLTWERKDNERNSGNAEKSAAEWGIHYAN